MKKRLAQIAIVPCIATGMWQVFEQYVYTTKAGIVIVVPKDFETDLASIPSLLRWLYPRCRVDYATAAVVHDVLIKKYPQLGRDFADKVFREILDITTDEKTEEIFYESVSFWSRVKGWLSGW